MSRSEHFEVGANEHRDPRSWHPHMNDYPSGIGNVGGTESTVGYVPTATLAGMHGNATDRRGVDRWKERLQSGEGFTDPVMVEFDPATKRAVVGEGNHRVEAAKELGISHVPARVVRSRISDREVDFIENPPGDRGRGRGGHVGRVDPPESPWRGGLGEPYWPPTMHPRYVFKDTLPDS